MNALWDVFEGKLDKLLGGRSPMVAFQGQTIAIDLLGHCFFFVGALPSKFAWRSPQARVKSGAVGADDGSAQDAVLWGYDHSVFANAAAAVTPIGYDEVNAIVTVARIASGSYGSGLPRVDGISLFDHSLEAHKYTRAGDGKVFFIQEQSAGHPEKLYKYALAELILDGVTEVSIPDSYDKYLCFRIHNLNYGPATVTFGSAPHATVVTVPALGCKTVRRDREVTTNQIGTIISIQFKNYRTGKYFFDCERGEPRHFWIDPLNLLSTSDPASSMRANNVSCPSLIYDWISAMTKDATYARFLPDEGVYRDEYSKYADLFGNPGNGGTKLGDVVWHKGKVLLAKVHKTNKLPAPNDTLADIEFKELTYNGVDRVAAEWGPEGIDVTAGLTGGALIFRLSAAAAVNYSEFLLIPYGTNLFKDINGEVTAAYRLTTTTGPELQNAFFEQKPEDYLPQLGTTALQLLVHRRFDGAVNTAEWWDYSNPAAPVQHIVVGEPLLTLQTIVPQGAGTTTITDLQNHTVEELMSLRPFRDTTIPTELVTTSTPIPGYTRPSLVLTPFGLRLVFEELIPKTILGTPFAGGNDMRDFSNHPNEAYFFTQGGRYKIDALYLRRKWAIRFRGHGFGWPEKAQLPRDDVSARINAMFQSPRHGRRLGGSWFDGDARAAAGADYSVHSPGSLESGIKVLGQMKRNRLVGPAAGGRFWLPKPGDALNWIWEHVGDIGRSATGATLQAKIDVSRNKGTLVAGGTPSAQSDFIYPLLSEHYDGMAMAVNALTEGVGLNYKALRFNAVIGGLQKAVGIKRNPGYTGLPTGDTPGMPIPIDAWDFNAVDHPGDAGTFALYQAAGIPIRGINEQEMPGWSAIVTKKSYHAAVVGHVRVQISNSTFAKDNPNCVPDQFTACGGYWNGDAEVSVDYTVTYQEVDDHGRGAAGEVALPYTGGSLETFGNLATMYAGFQWVKQSEVLAWLSGFGLPALPAGFDEVFIPLELRVLKSTRQVTEGPHHNHKQHYSIKLQDNEFSFPGKFEHGSPDGTHVGNYFDQNSVIGAIRHVEALAFVPPKTADKAKWKAQSFTRTAKDIKFWEAEQPKYVLVQAQAMINPLSYTGILVFTQPRDDDFTGDNVFLSADGPFWHLIFEPTAEEKEDHELWLQCKIGLKAALAIRTGSGDPSASANVGYVMRPYWAPKKDTPYDTLVRLNRNYFESHFGVEASNVFWPQSVYPRRGGITYFEWEWVNGAGAGAPALAAGVNLLTGTGGGKDRYHVHFGDKDLGIIAL